MEDDGTTADTVKMTAPTSGRSSICPLSPLRGSGCSHVTQELGFLHMLAKKLFEFGFLFMFSQTVFAHLINFIYTCNKRLKSLLKAVAFQEKRNFVQNIFFRMSFVFAVGAGEIDHTFKTALWFHVFCNPQN